MEFIENELHKARTQVARLRSYKMEPVDWVYNTAWFCKIQFHIRLNWLLKIADTCKLQKKKDLESIQEVLDTTRCLFIAEIQYVIKRDNMPFEDCGKKLSKEFL